MKNKKEKIAVIGLWHLGAVTSGCLVKLGYRVIGFDENKENIASLNKGKAPVFEPGLDKLIAQGIRKKRIFFTNHLADAAKDASLTIIAFDTPVDEKDNVNLGPILKIIKKLTKYLKEGSTLLITSQIPVGNSEKIIGLIKDQRKNLDFSLLYSPENLRLGQAIKRFLSPDMLVIGYQNQKDLKRSSWFFKNFSSPKIETNLKTAEMTKHAINAFLATSISFGNEIARIADKIGANSLTIAKAMGQEQRIGKSLPLKPGLGFSGGTLARDMKVVKTLGQRFKIPLPLLEGVLQTNKLQFNIVKEKLQEVFHQLKGLKVATLGLTYKAGTSTLRRSASLQIIKDLVKSGMNCQGYDPKASPGELAKEFKEPGFTYYPTIETATKEVDALILLTDWGEFKNLDFRKLKDQMKQAVIIDTKNILDRKKLTKLGFTYVGIGQGGKEQ